MLAVCFFLTFLSRTLADTYTVMLRLVEAEFGSTRAQVTGVYSVVMLVAGLGAPAAGWLFQRFGGRLLYALGFCLLGIASLCAAAAKEMADLYLSIGLVGGLAGAALGMAPAATMVTWWFRQRTSIAIGIAYAGLGCGALVMVPLAQRLLERMSWRDTYCLFGVAAVIAGVLVQLLPWASIMARRPGPAAGENRATKGTLWHALRQRRFWLLVQVVFFTSLGMYIVLVQSVVYLTDVGFSPAQSAAAYGAAGMLSIVGVAASGWMAERFGHRRAATMTFAGSALGLLLLVLMSLAPSVWLLCAYVLLFGVCQGTRGPLVSSLSASFFRGPGYATIYGTILALLSVGSALGALTSGLLHDLTGGYYAGFAFALCCIGVAALPFWLSEAILAPSGD